MFSLFNKISVKDRKDAKDEQIMDLILLCTAYKG